MKEELFSQMRAFALIALIATFSGPLLREAEGAEDLARSLAELARGPLVEEVDGGVGDDSGATILTAKLTVITSPELVGFAGARGACAWGSTAIDVILTSACSRLTSFKHPPGIAGPPLLLAWLHRFLF